MSGKDAFLKSMPATLKAMFPNGLNMKFHSTIAEGPTGTDYTRPS